MKRLCFGTYASVLRACVPKKGTKLQTSKKKLVGLLLMSVDDTYNITDDDYTTSRLITCDNALPSNITENAQGKLADTTSVVDYFKAKILPLFNPNMLKLAVLALVDIVAADDAIKDDTAVELVDGKTKSALCSQDVVIAVDNWNGYVAQLLAGLFLYTAIAVNNKDGKRVRWRNKRTRTICALV